MFAFKCIERKNGDREACSSSFLYIVCCILESRGCVWLYNCIMLNQLSRWRKNAMLKWCKIKAEEKSMNTLLQEFYKGKIQPGQEAITEEQKRIWTSLLRIKMHCWITKKDRPSLTWQVWADSVQCRQEGWELPGGFPAVNNYKAVVQCPATRRSSYLSRLSNATTRVKIMRLIEMISKSLM